MFIFIILISELIKGATNDLLEGVVYALYGPGSPVHRFDKFHRRVASQLNVVQLQLLVAHQCQHPLRLVVHHEDRQQLVRECTHQLLECLDQEAELEVVLLEVGRNLQLYEVPQCRRQIQQDHHMRVLECDLPLVRSLLPFAFTLILLVQLV